MNELTIRAEAVRVGDQIYDSGHYMPGTWVPVTKTEPATGNYITIVTANWSTIKHRYEGIAVRRGA